MTDRFIQGNRSEGTKKIKEEKERKRRIQFKSTFHTNIYIQVSFRWGGHCFLVQLQSSLFLYNCNPFSTKHTYDMVDFGIVNV